MNQFEIHILFCGPNWQDQQTHLQKEKEIISSYLPEQVYNQHPSTIQKKENYRVICEIQGTVYGNQKRADKQVNAKLEFEGNFITTSQVI
jgi:hypothetical protein